jgi:carbonic anhydrase/acetyltransferase-like protein (isoleucine patch superfamily)
MLYRIDDRVPALDPTAYVAPNATLIGSVRMGPRASVWFGAVLRGDDEWIEIGADSNVQDLSMIHADHGLPTRLGARVTIGHKVMLHGCSIGDDALIGNGAIVLDGAEIGAFSIVAAGSVVAPGKRFEPGVMLMGAPAKAVRVLTDVERTSMARAWQHYVATAQRYACGLAPFERS